MCGQTTSMVRAKVLPWWRPRGLLCRMSAPPDRGFTLIELLTVISIISLLVSILMPSLSTVRETANRAKCAANLHSIGLGLIAYGQDNGGYPLVPCAGWGGAVGAARDTDPFDKTKAPQARSATANLYMLVHSRDALAGHFVCPSTREEPDGVSDPAVNWDFTEGKNVSYAVQNPYGDKGYFNEGADYVVLVADQGPYFETATGKRNTQAAVDLSVIPSDATIRKANSPNHKTDGQNVMYMGGTVKFERRADCGRDRDNIYTRAADPKTTDPAGTIPAPGADPNLPGQGPAGPNDAFLLP